jgi:hypothetical protein
MPEMTRENAVEIVTRKFRAVHKAIETAQEDALDLHRAFLEAGRLLGVHPGVVNGRPGSAFTGDYIAKVVADLSSAQLASTLAHSGAKEIEESLANPQPLGGGNGKGWP